ncbi:hypothetical protein HGP17_09495 [Rhizobium sp. P38BS-XIX]|nr:hypothetical protein [Rhizobium sp. P38BS-XIX]
MNVIARYIEKASTSACITQRAEALSAQLRAVGERAFPPNAQKYLRSFSSEEGAEVVGVSDGYLRQLSLDGLAPAPDLANSRRRSYSLEQINEVATLALTGKPCTIQISRNRNEAFANLLMGRLPELYAHLRGQSASSEE